MSEDIFRSMPVSDEAERAILSCILKRPDRLDDALDIFSPEWFYVPANRKVFQTMGRVVSSGKALDLITLIERLDDDGLLEEVGGRAGVAELLNEIPTDGFFEHYISILKNKFILRQIISEASDFVKSAYDAPEDAQALADRAVEAMARVSECAVSKKSIPSMRERTLDALERYTLAFEGGELQGLSTGLLHLDSMTGGLKKSDLIIIGARPSFGKTALMTQIGGHVATVLKEPIGILSGEMGGGSITDRFFSQMAEVDLRKLGSGNFKKDDFDKLVRESRLLADSNIWIEDRGGLTISEIRRIGRRWKAKEGVKLIMLDYLQRYRADSDKENADERARYGAITAGLKDMAKELDIPVIALVQLARRADGKTASQIHQGDAEGCSKIEQDADFMGFLGMPEIEEEIDPIFRDIDMNIVKQRQGPTGLIHLRFRKSHTLFSEKPEL